ncbi:MFS transporter [Jeotgalibacillus proteolyticus]|uniref:MFS transporter n=1 Tax=Jeotgalibacillus proteolyticus TaxID=2082395 RepID=A0A2S5GDL8_9BACL|nr:MFS transporter [Jeotgalibacillus proteolyticus]PPA71011.1 MFS transporter [Jeotgalibacillus proteolyticus]
MRSILHTFSKETRYQKLFWAGLINGIGSRFSQVAIFTLLFQLTGSGMAIGIVLAIRMLPFLFFAPIGGMLADKYSVKKMLIVIDAFRVFVVLAFLFVRGPEDVWIIYTASFLLACGEALYAPARISTIPSLVKRERLLSINAIEQAMVGLVLVVGASAGGVISDLLGLSAPFLLNGLTFLLSAVILSSLHLPESKQVPAAAQRAQMPAGLITGSDVLLAFFFIAITMPLANGIDNVLISIYALDVFEMGELGVGLMYASLGLGFIISSLFSNWLKSGLLVLTVIFIALEGLAHIGLSMVPVFWMALLMVVLITFTGGISNICIDTVMMKVIPREKRGTIFGFMQAVANTALGFSMAAGGFLLEIFEPRFLSILVGVAYLIFTAVYALIFSNMDLIKEKKELIRKVG